MSPEEIIRRVAEQSFLICFEKDAKNKNPGRKITPAMVGKALDQLLERTNQNG